MNEQIETNKKNIEILCNDPKIIVIEKFIDDFECEHLINIGKPNLKNSVVSDSNGGRISNGRTSKTSWIDIYQDRITEKISTNISNFVNMPLKNSENFQLVYYDLNNEYKSHYDSWDHDGSEKTLRCIKYGGPRILTALLYLNDVEEGGHTYFTKLNISVKPSKGKLLIFENVYGNSINKHLLSEHSGTPVLKGEKYIVNLWFRHYERNKLYSESNPEYYKKLENKILPYEFNNNINQIDNVLTEEECQNLINNCVFTDNLKYPNCWLKKTEYPSLISKISSLCNINSDYFENINIVRYLPSQTHGPFLDAYDISTEKGKKFTNKLGQRIKTICIFLSNNITYEFKDLSTKKIYSKGTLIIYNNNIYGTNNRNNLMYHNIKNNNRVYGYLLNIYVREFDSERKINLLSEIEKIDNKIEDEVIDKKGENEKEVFNEVLNMFKENRININWNGYKNFKYLFKGDFDYFKYCILKFIELRENKKSINNKHLQTIFNFDEYEPIILDNIIHNDLLKLCQSYYKKTINNNVWKLGDRQSNRFKAHNEPLSRFLHYEILPIIENITGKNLRPTYTYLSSYTHNSDLPPHTDREDCEYTVSFLVNYDQDWPIYFHKIKQPVKYKGRMENTPPLSECLKLYCNRGGIIIFSGTDHIHFRNKFTGNYYDVLLLHYVEK